LKGRKELAPCSRCGLVNNVGYSPNYAFDQGLWDTKTLIPSHFHFLRTSSLHARTGSREPLSTKQQFSLDSIASCIENDHLNNSEDGSAIKRDKKSGRKEQFFTINYLPIVVAMGTS
jgi:hypothetical protein